MFKEVLLVTPKLAADGMAAMEKALNSRFARVAQRFGRGLVSTLKGGGIAGAALGIIDKLINPLKETQEAIDRTLKSSDDIVTNAKQFGTTAGKLARLQAFAQSTGLDAPSLFMLIEKFQTAVAEAAADPTKETAVRKFVGEKDSAAAFFEFIQSLKTLESNQQIRVQQEIFGEKQILKMADFLQTDFAAQAKAIGGPSSETLTKAFVKLGDLNDLKDVLEARRGLDDAVTKSRSINAGMVTAQDKQLREQLEKENKRIKSYDSLAEISVSSAKLLGLAETAILSATSWATKFTDLSNNVDKIANSRWVKGILNLGGK